jgi:hypothetical protein
MNYYYLLIPGVGAPILGYILSNQKNETPTGLLKMQRLSDVVSENPSWHLPIVIVGMFLSFVYNLGIYGLHFIRFILGYVGFVLNWIYEKIILPVIRVLYKVVVLVVDLLLMILRLIINYFVHIPINVFLSVIKSVPHVINWQNYLRSLKILVLGFIAYAILEFIGFIVDQPLLGMIGGPFSLAISITWIVGLTSFDSHAHGKKAAIFAVSVIGLIVGIAALIIGPNQLDSVHGWGGVFAGSWYVPSVVGVMSVILLVLTVAFITNVGAIYINTNGEGKGFKDRIKGVASDSFARSWYFLWQPVFVLIIGGVVSIVPYYLMNFSSERLQDKVVQSVMFSKQKSLDAELKANTISDEMGWIMNDTLTDKEFSACLDTLERESDLRLRSAENGRYNDYLQKTIPLRSIPVAVQTKQEREKELKALRDARKVRADEKKSVMKDLDETMKEMQGDTLYSQESLTALKTKRERTEKLFNSLLLSADNEIAFRESCGLKYNMTYLLFLIGKAVLFSVLFALIVNLYGYSVLPVYSMHTSSYLASEVQSANQKDPMQPWVGLLIAALLAGGFYAGGDMISKVKGLFESSPATVQVKNEGKPEQSGSPEVPPVEVNEVEQQEPLMEEDVSDMPDGETEYFMCYDGSYIPNSKVYDGYCDCSSCEDEEMGD